MGKTVLGPPPEAHTTLQPEHKASQALGTSGGNAGSQAGPGGRPLGTVKMHGNNRMEALVCGAQRQRGSSYGHRGTSDLPATLSRTKGGSPRARTMSSVLTTERRGLQCRHQMEGFLSLLKARIDLPSLWHLTQQNVCMTTQLTHYADTAPACQPHMDE